MFCVVFGGADGKGGENEMMDFSMGLTAVTAVLHLRLLSRPRNCGLVPSDFVMQGHVDAELLQRWR